MAMMQLDNESMTYQPAPTPRTPNPVTPSSGSVAKTAYNQQAGSPYDTSNMNGDPTSSMGSLYNSWSDPYTKMLAELRGSAVGGGSGGGGVARSDVPQFDKQYTDYRDSMYTNIANLMARPQGYSEPQLALMRGGATDAVNAQAGGARQAALSNASRMGLMGTGAGMIGVDNVNRNLDTQLANQNRDITLADMEAARKGAYDANAAGQQWAGMMGGEQAGQQGVKIQNEQDYQNRVSAANNAQAGAANARQNQIMQLQYEIAQQDQAKEKYDNQLAFTMMDQQNQYANQLAGYDQQSYASNPNYTGNRNPFGI